MSNKNVEKDISNALITLRKEKQLSQQELADILGVSISAICLYEQGKRFPGQKMINKICNYFNVDMNYLYGMSDVKNTIQASSLLGRDITVYNRKKLINDGSGLSKTNKVIFDLDEATAVLNLPKTLFKKNRSYFAINAIEDTLQNFGITGEDICVFAEANVEDLSNNKIVCALIGGKVVIRKFVQEDEDCYYLYNGSEDTAPKKVMINSKEHIIGVLSLVISNKQ